MSKVNLYNKYRPLSFSEVIGQDLVKVLLANVLNQDKLIQSFLFYGAHGTGKTSMARIFAKMWNCERFSELGDVCNECKNCKLINESKTMDIIEIDSASNSGVDNVREIIQNSQYMPLDLNKKIYLIDECHNLSNPAWNAFLRTIEEPYDSVIFIFLTTSIHRIPSTILSRCQKYNFSLLSTEEMERVVDRVATGEERELDLDARNMLITLSKGVARECVTLMEQLFLMTDQKSISIENIEHLFALTNKEDHLRFLELLGHGEVGKLLEMVDRVVVQNMHMLHYFQSLLDIMMEMHIYSITGDASLLSRLLPGEVRRLMEFDIPYMGLCEVLFSSIQSFGSSVSKGDWAKMVLFRLLDAIGVRPERPSIQEIKKEKKAVEKIEEHVEETHRDLRFPKEVELKVLYNTVKINRDDKKSIDHMKMYQNLKEDNRMTPKLAEVMFRNGAFFPGNKLITTDRTVLMLFQSQQSADLFNEVVKGDPNMEKELNELFIGDYFWWGASIEQMKYNAARTDRPSDAEINEAFNKSQNIIVFENLLQIFGEEK